VTEHAKVTAACILIRRDDKFLAVARRGTTDEWGLPGGKIDNDETPAEAASRELQEETGLVVLAGDLQPAFVSHCGPGVDGKTFKVVTFIPIKYSGTVASGDAGPVDWVDIDKLMEGPFGTYNKELFQAVYGKK
jgi:8-oxo-dGTP pyrophosphatase MutT (NUDIX family)